MTQLIEMEHPLDSGMESELTVPVGSRILEIWVVGCTLHLAVLGDWSLPWSSLKLHYRYLSQETSCMGVWDASYLGSFVSPVAGVVGQRCFVFGSLVEAPV